MKVSPVLNAWAFAVIGLITVPPLSAGAYVFAGSTYGLNLILHPKGYTGTESELTITVCIDPASVGSSELGMEAAISRIVETFNQRLPTTSNLRFGASNDIPSGMLDLESAALHELGHCLGLAHVNAASESGLSDPQANYTKTERGPDNVFSLNDGADNVIGSCDDQRGDDRNLHWFRKATNNPFEKAAIVDKLTYSRDLADLPSTSTCNGGQHRFATNGDRSVAILMGYPGTEAVMQQGMGSDEEQRTLTADDVATLEYAMSGLDEIAGTSDDYDLVVEYGGIRTAGCDVTLKITNTSALAFCSVGGITVPSGPGLIHAAITTASIEFGSDFDWFYGFSTLTVVPTFNGGSVGQVTSSPSGISCPVDCDQQWASGQQLIQLTATAPLGHKFSGWSGDPDCSDGRIDLNVDTTCGATFDIASQYPLSVSVIQAGGIGSVTSSPSGIDCPGDCSEVYYETQSITLTATPGPDSYFVGWSGHADCTDGVVALTSARSCTATFANAILFEDGLESGDTSAWDKTEGL